MLATSDALKEFQLACAETRQHLVGFLSSQAATTIKAAPLSGRDSFAAHTQRLILQTMQKLGNAGGSQAAYHTTAIVRRKEL